MGHTNSTTNYNLPQFLSSDKPAWLTDINGAFSDIDVAVKAAKDAGDNAQNDATQALSDASAAGSTASGADTKASGAVASIAENFSTTDTYDIGDLVMYNNLLYICIADVDTPGAWTGSTNWSRKTVDELCTSLRSDVDDNTNDISTLNTAVSNKLDVSTFNNAKPRIVSFGSTTAQTINSLSAVQIGSQAIEDFSETGDYICVLVLPCSLNTSNNAVYVDLLVDNNVSNDLLITAGFTGNNTLVCMAKVNLSAGTRNLKVRVRVDNTGKSISINSYVPLNMLMFKA